MENFLDLVIAFSLAIIGSATWWARRSRAAPCSTQLGDPAEPRAAGAYVAESGGNPLLTHIGVDPTMGNHEGKEVRFGVAASTVFNVSATGTSTGAVTALPTATCRSAG